MPNLFEEEKPLSPREHFLVTKAAEMAEKKVTDSFFREVGKAVVNRFLIIVGLVAVAFALGKGWITPGSLK